jgi:proline dehydrogenase
MLRTALLAASRSTAVQRLVVAAPPTAALVRRFVAGTELPDAIAATRALAADGLHVSLDHLGEDTTEEAQAATTTDAYLRLLKVLAETGLAGHAEVSLKLSALGQALPRDGHRIARDNAYRICQAAADAGTTATLDAEDHTTTDSTLDVLAGLRTDFPWLGAVLQAALRRTEADCRDLATAGSRIRLCKGAYREPASVAFTSRADIDRSYVRCLGVLMAGDGYPMVASHDPRLIAIAGMLAADHDRGPDSYEHQMLYGIRPDEQRRLAASGHTVRVYVPYGDQWYGYFMRRLAERPANVAFFVRSVATRG